MEKEDLEKFLGKLINKGVYKMGNIEVNQKAPGFEIEGLFDLTAESI